MIYDEYLAGRKAFRCNKEIGPENTVSVHPTPGVTERPARNIYTVFQRVTTQQPCQACKMRLQRFVI
jgi:hypothetical protein